MTRIKNMTATLNQIIEQTRAQRAGHRADSAWYYLRQAFPTMAEQGRAGLAQHILLHTGE